MTDSSNTKKTKKSTKAEVQELEVIAPAKEPEIVDVDLGYVEKKKFRFGNDNSRILELNVSDLNVITRLSKTYPELQNAVERAQSAVNSLSDDCELSDIADVLESIDKEMREKIDYIFDTNVSEVCVPSGNMYDPVGGQFRFERVIMKLAELYGNGLNYEFANLRTNTAKHTAKYTKK